MYIPLAPGPGDLITRSIGLIPALAMARVFGSDRLLIPVTSTHLRRRARIVAMRADHVSISRIALKLRCTERYVYKVLALCRAPERVRCRSDNVRADRRAIETWTNRQPARLTRTAAEFLIAVQRVLADEGGDSSNPADAGGATRFGISARAYPGVDIATLTRDAAVKIYWDEWWLRFGFAQLPAAVAAKTFDLAVNMGAGNAIECLQRALRASGVPVTEDGAIGPATASAAARAEPGRADGRDAIGVRRALPAGRREAKPRSGISQRLAQSRVCVSRCEAANTFEGRGFSGD